jgi:hypothetical protein
MLFRWAGFSVVVGVWGALRRRPKGLLEADEVGVPF